MTVQKKLIVKHLLLKLQEFYINKKLTEFEISDYIKMYNKNYNDLNALLSDINDPCWNYEFIKIVLKYIIIL